MCFQHHTQTWKPKLSRADCLSCYSYSCRSGLKLKSLFQNLTTRLAPRRHLTRPGWFGPQHFDNSHGSLNFSLRRLLEYYNNRLWARSPAFAHFLKERVIKHVKSVYHPQTSGCGELGRPTDFTMKRVSKENMKVWLNCPDIMIVKICEETVLWIWSPVNSVSRYQLLPLIYSFV